MYTILPQSFTADACAIADLWGEEDALEDIRPCAAAFYKPDSPQWHAYYAGYQRGVEFLFRLTGRYTANQLGLVTERPREALVDMEARLNVRYF